ncbi:flavin reductase family protein [Pseudorhodobacter turbinis]|uniref:Flavin reductase family protein n=1 Tax=Pseudorhodobacter turbinis TaxID=2500533 RepID=A0A4P8EFW4_9RHOB|nr:flavin reductase family protein [Pseudorhodobacter turbinis]QCO55707.1 flavin reductase family protein [Pseudorhodobacter turbinis]
MTDESFTPDATNARAFRDALGCFATGVTIVTVAGDHGPMGFTANSFASLSMDPPLVLWSPAKRSSRFEQFAGARHYAIHVLADAQGDLIQRFIRGGLGFEGMSYHHNAEGVPLIAGALARFDCVQHATHDGGDHLIIVGRVLRCVRNAGAPLVFTQGRYGQFSASE